MIKVIDLNWKLYTHWKQSNVNRYVQNIKKEVLGKRKWNLDNNTIGAEKSAALIDENTVHHEASLKEDNLQWTGMNNLLSADKISRLDALNISENNNIV